MLWNQLSAVTLLTSLLDPRPRLEGSYKIGSVCQFVFLSILPPVQKFSRDWLISFFWNLTCVRGQYIVAWDRAGFFGKNPYWAKMTENGQKCPKNMVLYFLGKLRPWFCLEFVLSESALLKLHAWKKCGSHVITKNVSQPMRFEYSLIVNISLID